MHADAWAPYGFAFGKSSLRNASVSAAHSVNECRFVDDEEAVVELVGGLDRERVGVLRVDARGRCRSAEI